MLSYSSIPVLFCQLYDSTFNLRKPCSIDSEVYLDWTDYGSDQCSSSTVLGDWVRIFTNLTVPLYKLGSKYTHLKVIIMCQIELTDVLFVLYILMMDLCLSASALSQLDYTMTLYNQSLWINLLSVLLLYSHTYSHSRDTIWHTIRRKLEYSTWMIGNSDTSEGYLRLDDSILAYILGCTTSLHQDDKWPCEDLNPPTTQVGHKTMAHDMAVGTQWLLFHS